MGSKILLIDDDLPLVRSLTRTLDFCGFVVLNAPDGMLGVQMALRHKPDLIILELHFPAGGAQFVLQNLRRSLITRDIPFLLYTSSLDEQAKKRLLDFGVLTYVQKSSDREGLLAQIHSQLESGYDQSLRHSSATTSDSGDFKRSSPTSEPLNPQAKNKQ